MGKKTTFIWITVVVYILVLINLFWLVSHNYFLKNSNEIITTFIIASLISVISLVSIRGLEEEKIYEKKRNILLLIINILIGLWGLMRVFSQYIIG